MLDFVPPLKSKPVLAALDLAEQSASCLRYGCEMAAKFGQPLILLHVVHETVENAGMYRRFHKASDTTPMAEIALKMLEEQVALYQAACDDLDRICETKCMVVSGIPETRIAEVAAHCDAGMIVMCSHNRQGIDRLLHGSVAESVMHRASCPVVILDKEQVPVQSPLPAHRPAAQTAGTAQVM